MKRHLHTGVIWILIFVVAFSGIVYANNDIQRAETIPVEVFDISKEDYDTESVSVVNLMFGKEDILTTDVPAFILDERTLVPIYFIAETLEADIKWNQEKRQATINKGGKEIVLTIDSAYAEVNGKMEELPSGVPAKLVSYQGSARTVVPLRFVSEQLGMEVKWFGDTYTAVIDLPHKSVKDIEYTTYNGLPAIAIKTNGEVNYNPMYLPAVKLGTTDRLVIDIPNTDLGSSNFYNESVNKNGILGFRASLFETSPREMVRVTIDMEMESKYDTFFDGFSNTIYVTFTNDVSDIVYEENAHAIVIKTAETPVYNVMDLEDRVVVDILDAQLTGSLDEVPISIDSDVVEQIRYSQYDSDYPGYDKVVRAVFDLKPGKNLSNNMYVEGINDNVVVYMTNDPMNQYKYEYIGVNKSTLKLEFDGTSTSLVTKDDVNNIMTIQVEKDKIDLLDDVKLDMYDGIIKYIKIDGESDRNYYNLTIKYDTETTAKIITGNTKSSEVVIEFAGEGTSIDNLQYGNIVIAIDPGHGGKDPGASVNGVHEKTLNLDTSLKLKDLLEEAGFKVALTRSTDVYIGLYERAHLANALNADVFLSIHHNAVPSKPSVQGVLTLYDGSKIPAKTTFAKTIQRNMVSGLGAKDMKLMNKPKYIVTRETNMASALAELGFMTNPYELSLLTQDYYRQKCAQALFNGIKEYVDTQILN